MKKLVVAVGSVNSGDDALARLWQSDWPGEAICGEAGALNMSSVALFRYPQIYRVCLMRAVSSCTRLYTERSSRIMRAIFEVAWMTVVWSRPPNSLPIFGSDESVNSRERYIATCRG